MLNPSEADEYDALLTCLTDGYDEDLHELIPHFEPSLDANIRLEVREILNMFRALDPGQGKKPAVPFPGFDGNDETEHFAYARFLLKDRRLWRESNPADNNYNTHSATLDDYREMLSRWKDASNKQNLTEKEKAHILEAAPHSF